MDKLVFIVGKGKNAQFYKLDKDVVSVGRALANDIVIADGYVDARQLEINCAENRLKVTLMDYTNPVLVNGRPIENDSHFIALGDEVVVGRTVFSLHRESEVAEPTQKLFMARHLYSGFWRFILPLLALLLVFSCSVLLDVLQTPEKIEWGFILRNAFVFCLVIVVWSGVFGFSGRLIKHQHHFFSQLLIACGFAFLFMMAEPLSEYLGYAFDNETLVLLSFRLMVFMCFTGLLGLMLRLASNLKRSFFVAGGLCTFVLGAFWLFDYYDAEEFTPYANHFSVVKAPIVVFVEPLTIEQYLESVDQLFSEIEANDTDD
ncbi:MAG: FHA domain-containing protein [Pseudomonadales bacterium]|nr:FHA domain-containing protein [Pseudomonadales bacterium]